MAKFCPKCGAQLNEGAKFCRSCGQGLAAEDSQPAVQQQQEIQPPPQEQQPQIIQSQQNIQPQEYNFQPQIQQNTPFPVVSKNKKSKTPFIIAGGAVAALAVLAVILIFTNVFGLLNKDNSNGTQNIGSVSGNNANGNNGVDDINTYEVFGDGNLIKAPERLKAKASADDSISIAALIGEWQGIRSSINTEYGFSDDGWFYKNTMITHTHYNYTYHPGYWSYGSYYDTYYYGWTETNISYTYTYLDTLIGEYKVKGGVIEFFHIVAINRTNFDEDWYYKNTRSVSIESLQSTATSAKMQNDFYVEFEFINPERIRFRDATDDIDLFWHLRDVEHNVPIPKHEIPPVEWPSKALSSDMPQFATKGRYREASLSYSGNDKNIKPEFKTVTIVIDKTTALPEIDAYGKTLRNNGWWVEDYELGDEDTYLSYEARKGMFKLYINNGRGSGTSADTIVIESTKYQEGVWPKAWADATLVYPDNSVIVGNLEIETGVDINVYETIIFDKVNDAGVNAYADKLIKNGFRRPQYSYDDDWDYMKYVRINKDLYLSRVRISKRMDSLTSFTYDLTYTADGVWPESWTKAGLFPPESYDTIAGAIDKENWDKSMSEYGSEYVYVKYLGLTDNGKTAYMNKLKSSGFIPMKDWDGNETGELYNYLRIEKKMIRVEVSIMDNQDIAEIRYIFNCHEDGVWPDNWLSGGLPAPDKYETIIDAIDLNRWREDITGEWGGSSYMYIKYLGMTATDASNYITKLKNAGFKAVKDWDGNDTNEFYNYLRIDDDLYRVEVNRRENDELTEFLYKFDYYKDGEWPAIWQSGGLSAPDGNVIIVGAIDLNRWNEDITGDWGASSYVYIKYLGINAADKSKYITKLKNAGFKAIKDWDGKDTDELCGYLRIDGKLYRIQIEPRDNNELTEFLYRFEYYEDGVWPSSWTSAGIPAPTYTAIAGAIDINDFNDNLNNWGSYSTYIKLLGANLSDYAATLRKNGFTKPEYSWTDTWELQKQIQINGKSVDVIIEARNNQEIPEIYIYFRN